jgi:porin
MTQRFRKRLRVQALLGGAALATMISAPALADDAPDYSANLFGDLGGLREAFAKVGGKIQATEISEVFANPVGGLKRGANYDGVTTLTISVDTKDAFKWEGGTFNASLLNLHGDNYSVSNIGALQTISGAQGDRATRLWELWYDQKFGGNFDVRVGQQSLDVEFATSDSSAHFVNSLFGWPALHALDMPDGGPAYPLASPGVRVQYQSGAWTTLAGVFSGEPAANTDADPQHANPYGVSFPLHGALAIAETQYAVGKPDDDHAGLYKLGAWYDNLPFDDQRYNQFGQPLADPAVDPTPRQHRGNFGIYAVGEQRVWRGDEKERTLSLFLRPTFAPQGDRNFATFGINGGMALHDPLPGRKDDTFGLGFGVISLSPSAIGFSTDSAFYNPGVFTPKLSYEAVLEATYQYHATPYAQIQPDLQYVHNPGGGVADPVHPDRRIRDALVGGLRLNVTF